MRFILKHFDIRLVLIVLSLSGIGIMMISSVSEANIYGITSEVRIQTVSLILGFTFLLASLIVDYRLLGRLYIPIYALSILLLLLVYVPGLGVVRNEANSWIALGSIDFQTSEVAKIGFIIFFAQFFEKYKSKINTLKYLSLTVALAAPFFILLFKQPDFGTMIVFFSIFTGMLFVSKISMKIVIATVIVGILSLPVIYNFLGGYQKDRIDSFFNQSDTEIKGSRQVEMSKITMGTGGFLGNGLYKGAFSKNNYLPVKISDFIFPVLVEELGFVGGLVVIILYFMMLARFINIAFTARDDLGANIAVGVMFMFAFQIFENIGMTMGIMPVTGITLPFISYGGSSMLANIIAISLTMNVFFRRFSKRSDSSPSIKRVIN